VNLKTAASVFVALALWAPAAMGFSSDGSSVARNLNRSVVRTNSTVVVTVTFTNTEAVPLRGFYYAEQLPSSLSVTTLGVSLNNQPITNYIFEFGQDGDVYAGRTPYRWVLEQPPAFGQTNLVPAGGCVRVVYSVCSSVATSVGLDQFMWVGFVQAATNVAFGSSDSTDYRDLSFVSNAPPASLSASAATNGWRLQIDSLNGCSYAVQASTDLSDWVLLVTNTTPFTFTDTNSAAFPIRFYRGMWVP
jgi:hypothetical protein